MTILGIETSCDETALCIIDATGDAKNGIGIDILANLTLSQIELHRKYGGVFPNLAKREHQKNLVPLLEKTLAEAKMLRRENPSKEFHSQILENLGMILKREPELLRQFLEFVPAVGKPAIDLIAVTNGPGLEPCLWSGLNFAKSLSFTWNLPLVPVNHMEGHVFVSLLKQNENSDSQFLISRPAFPAIALLVSGGHTELVLVKNFLRYKIIGETRDDAVGEAFDKVARILGLSYPGGPEISRLAEKLRAAEKNYKPKWNLPRPMMKSGDFDFSFSGLKTAVLYAVKKLPEISEAARGEIAMEFEDAVTEVLVSKTKKAVEKYAAKTLILGGGVIANKNIRREFEKLARAEGKLPLFIPQIDHATDNAVMVALAGYFHSKNAGAADKLKVKAEGGARIDSFRDKD